MIESLETRRFFSTTPLYPAPSSVVSDALSIINATPVEVVASAAGNVASGQAPTQAMLDVIEYHEGYSLYIYPNASGVPTVGIGLTLGSGDASLSTAALNAAGVSYSALVQDWNSVKALWVSQHHPLRSLKDTSPLWARFVEQNPSVADPVLTSFQASTAFNYAVTTKLAAAAMFFGTPFYDVDRDPQIALVDLAYHVPDITKYRKLAADIQGNSVQSTNYALTAKQVHGTTNAPDTMQWTHDDQELVVDGEYPSSIGLTEPVTLVPGQKITLLLDGPYSPWYSIGAFGKGIILPISDFSWSLSADGIILAKEVGNGLQLHALRSGTVELALADRVSSTAAIPKLVVAASPQVSWQATETDPDIDGPFSAPGKITDTLDELVPGSVSLEISAAEGGSNLDIILDPLESIDTQTYNDNSAYIRITSGLDVWYSGVIDLTTLDDVSGYAAGTFTAGPNDASGQPGVISGSFSGVLTSERIFS